ncbi:putative unusual protein kinase regulating ubiquinone biosynthesis (AarF/ABC1/UbiB family) [Actinocorallia herbida]|uniref:Putative unusual protein kinase regulating ubiquinone biosynthesis (AarF/ABC1/UbiB family) n=1 Tax=Actinocorallia herbida TaxID=58109 RepID=A0A3N1D885_9ACTN|nr:AarF/UbiB family protein [Actinocorallia herbida]ROO89757.1 putative unusual protein kinase regulating ubiquinone biosynthesis (AarF/ABC1/UbiB family) [Actinocorallia herbida]
MTFRGPYADGPSPADLEIVSPRLDRLAWKDPARLVVVFFALFWHTVRRLALWAARRGEKDWRDGAAHGVVDAFEALGPTYVKLGQVVASSPGIFPQQLADAALRCLDEVPPIAGAEVRRILAEDLGGRPEDLFAAFDDAPLSAASIGQVHACRLPDGRDAVVKVQRPGIAALMATDLRVAYFFARRLERISKVMRAARPSAMIEDLHSVTFQELNSALEAKRQHDFLQRLHSFGDNEGVTAPEVYWDYCGPRVICMQRMYGIPLDAIDASASGAREIDGPDLLRRGVKAWVEAALVHGVFHGDVHAGNLWMLDDGRICYLDFGIMGELHGPWQELMKDMFYTGMFDADFGRMVPHYRSLGIIPEGTGTDAEIAMRLQLVFGPLLKSGMAGISIGKTITMLLDMAKQYDAESPRELVLISKQLLYFERYSKNLAPNWVLFADKSIARNVFPEAVAAAEAKEAEAAKAAE